MISQQKFGSNNETKDPWNDYLAGLIDGDGSLLISKAKYTSLEIPMDIYDEYALNKVKQKLGGSIKLRSGAKAFRYRLHHKTGMLNLIHRINGKIRQSKRIVQLKNICTKLDIPFKEPVPLTPNSSWFAGFFDADGTIGFSMKKGWPQLTLSVSQKEKTNLLPFQKIFGGSIRLDRATNTYKWDLYAEESIFEFSNYLKAYPLQSHKKNRFFLLKHFYSLKSCRAYRQETNSLLYKAWLKFKTDWNNFEISLRRLLSSNIFRWLKIKSTVNDSKNR